MDPLPEIGGPPPAATDPPAPPAPPATPAAPAASTESRPATLQDLAEAEAKKQGVDPRLVHAVIQTESSYNPAATSPKGAKGLMQLMPATAAKWKVTDPTNPVENIRGGVSELKALLDEHKGDVTTALQRYNGSATADPAVTQAYAQKVLGLVKPSGPQMTFATVNGQQVPIDQDPAAATSTPAGGNQAPSSTPPRPTSTGMIATPPPKPPTETWGQWAIRQGKGIAESFDPRTTGGRQNLAGMGGAAAATAGMIATAPVSVPVVGLTAATAGVLGAMGGGFLADAGEQLAGTKPPSSASVLEAGGAQGLQEAAGHALMWPVQAVGRRMVASRVGRYAAEGINAAKTAALTKLQGALDTAQTAFRQAKAGATLTNAQAATSTRGMVTSAAQAAKQGVAQAGEVGERAEASAAGDVPVTVPTKATAGAGHVQQSYEQMVGTPPPSAAAAGRATNEVIQKGGAAEARNMAGRAVDEAAQSGPELDITGLKAEAQRVVEGQIRPPETSFPRRSAEEVAGEAADAENAHIAAVTGLTPEEVTGMAKRAAEDPTGAAAKAWQLIKKQGTEFLQNAPAATLTPAQQALAEAQGEAGKESLKHPAMAVLQRILNAGDTVPFHDAHLWKVELDNAIRNTRDQAVKSQVAALTQKFTGSLRSALRDAGHVPYEEATAAYAKIAPLYTKGYAAQLKRVATEAPESIVSMLNPNQPTKAKMLVDLLTHQAAEGGDAAGGQAALEAVQSAWVRKKIIDGGIEKIGDRLAKIPPEFKAAFLSDPKAQAVLDNLQLIHTAYQTALKTGEQGVEAATAAGQAGVAAARTTREGIMQQTRQATAQGVEQVAQQVAPARQALREGKAGFTAQERALKGSSLRASMLPGAAERTGGDVLRFATLGTGSVWGAMSLARLLKGPTASDLVHWAAASPAGTRLFVKAITSAAPAMAIADLTRASGILNAATGQAKKAAHTVKTAAVGAPPPPAATVGTPPPQPQP